MVSVAVALVLAIWQWVGEREGNRVVMVESKLKASLIDFRCLPRLT